MEINNKYKSTIFGSIPKEWKIVRFSDVADSEKKWSITGGPFGSNLKASDYVSEGIRIIQLQNIGDGIFHNDYAIYTSERKADELFSCNIFPGDIILSKMGNPVARACFVPNRDNRYLMSSDGIRLVVNEKQFDKSFVLNFINSNYFRKLVIDSSTGSTRQRIGLDDLKKLPFISPPLSEQRVIAEVLSDVDALITSLEDLIVKKVAIKNGVMQELLTGKKRIKEFSSSWKYITLGEIAIIKTGEKNNDDKIENGTYPFFVRSPNIERINTYSFDGEAILIPGEGNIGNIFHYINGKFDFHQRVYKISNFPSDICGKYIYYSLVQNFKSYALSRSVKATVDSLRLPTFEHFEFCIPVDIREQKMIVKIISDIEMEINNLNKTRNKYNALKKSMMQQLLTGRIRLSGG